MKKTILFADYGFVILALLLFSQALMILFLTGGASQGDGTETQSSYPLIQFAFSIIFVLTTFKLLTFWKQATDILIKEKFILLFLAVAFVSILWSETQTITGRRAVAITGTTLFGVYFGIRYNIKQQLTLLAWTFGIAILLSFVFALTFPAYGIMGGPIHAGTWRGIYAHKNTLGGAMTTSLLVFLLLASSGKHSLNSRPFVYLGLGLSIVLLILSTSKAALLNAAIILASLATYSLWRRLYNVLAPTMIALVLTAGCLLLDIKAIPIVLPHAISPPPAIQSTFADGSSPPAEPILFSVDTFKTLTGRTDLWLILLDKIKQQPWLGFGYDSFWRSGANSPSNDVLATIRNWSPVHAHNGFLDLWLSLGLLGISIFILSILRVFRQLIARRHHKAEVEHLWPGLYILYFILLNLTESSLARPNHIYWVMYVAVVCSATAVTYGYVDDIFEPHAK